MMSETLILRWQQICNIIRELPTQKMFITRDTKTERIPQRIIPDREVKSETELTRLVRRKERTSTINNAGIYVPYLPINCPLALDFSCAEFLICIMKLKSFHTCYLYSKIDIHASILQSILRLCIFLISKVEISGAIIVW